ncbi:hypothetical protein [Rhodococcus sp. NPDC057529]|uniref:hypothetical protein n=1 Tax=Rhodococcus sp. NPDC057529 TaxID=3346158 RepID=UPI0036708253
MRATRTRTRSGWRTGPADTDLVLSALDYVFVSHAFLTWLRTGDEPGVVSTERRGARFAESTISARVGAVLSCYDYHGLNGVDVGRDLHRITHRGGGRYKPLLEHVARRKGRRQAVIRVRRRS